jgi:hypothetical protein
MTELPGVRAATKPEVALIVATLLLLLVHVPPVGESLSALVAEVHILVPPVIAAGN